MAEGIGSYLQELRRERNLTTTAWAQKAGIRRATLSDWQTGKRQPRLPELQAALTALGASDAQKRKAKEQLRSPTNLLRLRNEIAASHQELVDVAGMVPHGGDLLRAMRLRKGWTQAALATQMGVSQATVVRWERAERWPETEDLQMLCFLLQAREEELTALTTGRFSLADSQPALTEEEIRLQLASLYRTWYSPQEYGLMELRLLSLMSQAWPLAMQHRSGYRLLAWVYGEYADYLYMMRRFGECCEAANRTLDIHAILRCKDETTNRAAIRLATATAQRGSRQGLEAAIVLMEQWRPEASEAVFKGWILSNLAQFKAALGVLDDAIALSRQAVQETEENADANDYLHRRFDLVRILAQAGRTQEAQAVAVKSSHSPFFIHPFYTLVRAETYFCMGKIAAAQELIKKVTATLEHPAGMITQPEVAYYRPIVDNLAEQTEAARAKE